MPADRRAKTLLMFCVLGLLLSTWPLLSVPLPEEMSRSEVVNAVQDLRIATAEKRIEKMEALTFAMNEKLTYLLGGIGILYVVIALGYVDLRKRNAK